MPKKNILLAMFDVRPGEPVDFDFEKSGEIKEKIDLRQKLIISEKNKIKEPIELAGFFDDQPIRSLPKQDKRGDKILIEPKLQPKIEASKEQKKIPLSKREVLMEFEKTIAEPIDVTAQLMNFGAEFYPIKKSNYLDSEQVVLAKKENIKEENYVYANISHALKEKNQNNQLTEIETAALKIEQSKNSDLEKFWKPTLASSQAAVLPTKQLGKFLSPISREVEIHLQKGLIGNRRTSPIKNNKEPFKPAYQKIKPKWNSWFRKRSFVIFAIIGFSAFGAFGYVQKSGILAKNNIVQNGNNAVANLKEAKQDLENFNFVKAADSFALAYDDFDKASSTLSQLGASFLSVFGDIPGLSKIKAANNLVEAGQSMSKAGENLSLAFATLYKSNLFSLVGSNSKNDGSLGKIVGEFKDVLEDADKNIKKANVLLADIDASVLPEDKQTTFLDFKEKIPTFEKYINEAIDYSKFMYNFVGAGGQKKYLVLLQNNSELRATGGFPGTYAMIEFENGNLKNMFVDDVYQIDANLKENIIPPTSMQHITPNWGMRDANWFADFPTSAKKVEEFYKLDGGGEVDGVLSITPDIIKDILAMVGPIDMPEYGMKLSADNFLEQVQEEVEYKADRSKPKKILSDFQPKFLEKLAQQNRDSWIEIFKLLLNGLKEKHVLAYFNNLELQKLSVENGFAGEIKNVLADYLQVVFSNVKGSKTDFVTENNFNLKINKEEMGDFSHELTIDRKHNGGNSKFGFYNKDNSSYVRVYVPLGAKLQEIKGQSIVDFKPLLDYENSNFKTDKDLENIESGISNPMPGVDVFEESGRTVFGFWVITKPGQSESATLKYSVSKEVAAPADKFSLYWQKQSGTDADLAQVNYNGKVEQFNLSLDREFTTDN